MKLSQIFENSDPKLYHLSTSKTLSKLTPKIPDKLKVRTNAFEDTKISRISFAESIDGCILGIQFNEDEFSESKLFIYSPVDFNDGKWLSNKELISQQLVFDAKITTEWWCLNSINVKLLGEVNVTNQIIKTIEYDPIRIGDPKFLKPNGKLDTFLYKSDVIWY